MTDSLEPQYLENRQSLETGDSNDWFSQRVQKARENLQVQPTGSPSPDVVSGTQPKQSSLIGTLGQGWENIKDVVKGTGELALTTMTGAAAWPIAKAGGLMTLPFWGGEEAQKFEEYVSNLYTYQPTSQTGKGSTELVGKAMEIPFIPAKWLGNIAEKITGSPDAKYGVTAIGEVATMLLIPKVTEGVKSKLSIPTKEVKVSDVAIEKPKPISKEQALSKTRGDLTAEMEKINQRAHDALQQAFDDIPAKEWDKVYKEGKPVNLEEVGKLIENQAERVKERKKGLTVGDKDIEKLPQVYKDSLEKELRDRADNLKNIAKEADVSGTELIIIPNKYTPVSKIQEAFSKREFERTVQEKKVLSEYAGIIEGESGIRSFGDIARDLKQIIDFDERGSISGKGLEPAQLEAYKRIRKDFDAITNNAKKVGKTIDQYLTDLGMDSEVIKYIGNKASESGKTQESKLGLGELGYPDRGGKLPEGDIKVNLDRISNTEAIKNIIGEENLKQQEGRIEQTTRGVRSHDVTVKASQTKKGGVTVEDLLSRKPGEIWNAEQMTAARDIRDSFAVRVKDLTDKSLAGDMKAIDDLPSALALFGEIEAQRTGASAEVGRALESHKILSEAGRQPFELKQLADLASAVKKSVGDPIELAHRIKSLEKPEQVRTFARQLVDGLKKGVNIFNFAWINGLLSGPPTHVVNFATNSSAFIGGIETRRIAGRVGQVRRMFGGEGGVQVGEANQMVYGALEGFMNALETTKEAWIKNESQFGTGKIENYQKNPLSRESLGLTGSYEHSIEFLANTLENVGKVIGSPGRGLMVADEFWKSLNYRADLHASAFREATLEGLEGKTFGERVKYITDHPEEFDSIHKSAIDYAEYQTFTNELGPIGKSVIRISNATPFTKVVAPFVRTPIDILKYTQDYTPGLNMMSGRFYSDIASGGVKADLALAKMSMGVMITAATAYLVEQGLITGNGPYDKKLNALWREDHQSNSIKVGDTHVAFDRMDFPGNIMGIVADTISMVSDLELDQAHQILSATALAISNIMVNKTYLQGFSNFLAAIKTPEKGAETYVTNFTRSLVPNILRVGNRAFFDDTIREVNSIFDSIRSGIPGMSDKLPPKRGFWGQPVVSEGSLGPDILSPYRVKTDTHDPVNNEILSNKMELSMPPKVLGGYKPSDNPLQENQLRQTWGIKLSPEQYDRLIVLARDEVEIGGKNLHGKLVDLIKTPGYEHQSTGPDGGRALLIRTWINQYEVVAEQLLKKEFPELQEQISNQHRQRAESLRPQ